MRMLSSGFVRGFEDLWDLAGPSLPHGLRADGGQSNVEVRAKL